MIITCDECSTSFRLDESVLKAEGSKVRCSRCKHVFSAFPPGVDSTLEPETAAHPSMDRQSVFSLKPEDLESEDTASDDLDSDLFDFDDTDFDEDLSRDEKQADIEISFEDTDTDFDMEPGLSLEADEEHGPSGEYEQKEIEFDEAALEFDSDDLEPIEELEKPRDMPAEEMEEEALEGIDFETLESYPGQELTDEDDIKDFDQDLELETQEPEKEALDMALGEEASPEDLADQGMDFELEKDFSAYDEVLEKETEPQDTTDETVLADASDADEALSEEDDFETRDEFDLEEYEKTVSDDQDSEIPDSYAQGIEQPAPRRPSRAPLIQPLDPEAEMGDTAKRTRKKTRSALSAPVLVLLLLFLLTAGGYVAATSLGYKIPFLSEIKIPFIQQYLPQKTTDPVPAPDPVPDQKSVNGRFITNDNAGELFIITGKIENPAKIPYSRIQVKGTLFQKEKIAAMTQTAFCGNIVSEEELKTGDVDSIISRLKTPRISNGNDIPVRPGDSVPFMLVFSDLPKNLQNFTVEVMSFEKAEK